MGGVRGNFAGLKKLSSKTLKLTGADAKTAEKVAPVVGADMARTFDAGTDPYGEKWPATKTQGARTLNKTGALRASATTLTPVGRRIKYTLVSYGRYQNPRLFIPKAGEPPPGWEDIVEQAADEALREIAGA